MREERRATPVGDFIRAERLKLAMTQEDLAARTGDAITKRTIQRIEAGESTPSADTCLQIAGAFGIDVTVLTALLHPSKTVTSADSLDGYSRAVRTALESRSAPYVPLKTNRGSDLVEAISEAMRRAGVVLVRGSGGSGKTFAAMRFGATCSDRGEIVIAASAAAFAGDLDAWLARSVEPYSEVAANELVDAGNRFRRRVILIVDGANECAETQRLSLIAAIAAFRTRNSEAAVLVTTQRLDEFAEMRDATTIDVAACSETERLSIVRAYNPNATDLEIQEALVFRSPFDLARAARVWAPLTPQRRTRYDLWHAWAWEVLKRDAYPDLLSAVLRSFARHLRQGMRHAVPQHEFRLLVSRSFSEGVTAFERALDSCALLELKSGYIGFVHENIERLFLAEDLLQMRDRPAPSSEVMDSPRFADVIPLILEAQSERGAVRELFSTWKGCDQLFLEAARGEHGPLATEVAASEINTALQSAREAIAAYVCRIDASDPRAISAVAAEKHQLSTYERMMLGTAAILCSDSRWFQRVSPILNAVDKWVLSRAANEASVSGLRPERIEAALFEAIYGPLHSVAASQLLWSIHAHATIQGDPSKILDAALAAVWLSPGLALLACALMNKCRPDLMHSGPALDRQRLFQFVLRLIDCANTHRAGLVRMELFDLVSRRAHELADTQKVELRRLLEPFGRSKNPFVTTFFLEALEALGESFTCDGAEGVVDELRRALGAPDDPGAQQVAAAIVARQFEGLSAIAAPACEALEKLTTAETLRLHAMAALAPQPSFIASTFCVERIARCTLHDVQTEPMVERALRRWANPPATDAFSPREAASCFLVANRAIGRLGLNAPAEGPMTLRDKAWWLFGQLVQRRESGAEADDVWGELESSLLEDCVEPVCWLARACDLEAPHERGRYAFEAIAERWSERLRSLLVRILGLPGLQGTERRKTMFDDPREAMIRILRYVGSTEVRDELLRLVDDPVVGHAAVDAIAEMDVKSK